MNEPYDFHAKLEENAKNYPNKIALCVNGSNYTFQDIYHKIKCFSSQLYHSGIRKGDFVAIALPNSLEMIVTLYSVLSLRAIVLPLDSQLPEERIKMMIIDSNAKILVSSKESNSFNIDNITLSDNYKYMNETINNLEIPKPNKEDKAWCIFTSGSTGKPKGVVLKYEGIINHAYAKIDLLKLTSNDSVCLSFNMGFVASIWQIVTPVILGCTLHVYDENLIKKPYNFFQHMERDNASFVSVTPPTLNAFLEYSKTNREKLKLSKIRQIILTGEKIDRQLVSRFYNDYEHIQLINAYGQSECSDDTYHYIIPKNIDSDHVPIGKPIQNMLGFILDDKLSLVENGEKGELLIGGVGLVDCYINNRELSELKFIQTKYLDTPIYKTGDIVVLDSNNHVIYIGRADNQVNMFGYRIELEEIEACLNQMDSIIQSVVIVSENNTSLEVYYTSNDFIPTNDIRDFLSSKLPIYMIPSTFNQVEELLQTTNGKVDRGNVRECVIIKEMSAPSFESSVNLMNNTQVKIFGVIKECFKEVMPTIISWDVDIINNQVDSITFIQTVVTLESEFDFEFDDEKLLITEFPTVKTIIEYVESKVSA